MLSRQKRLEFNMSQHDRALRTLTAFWQLAEALGGVPGKKSIVWMTGDASPLNPSMLYTSILEDPKMQALGAEGAWFVAHVYQAINNAGASIFPLDVRGVLNTGHTGADHSVTHAEFNRMKRGSQPEDLHAYGGLTSLNQGEAANATLAMEGVAVETGGKVLRGSNDIGELLDRAQNLWSNYYVLSFDPAKVVNVDKPAYHKISVRILNNSGGSVISRRGFFTEVLDETVSDAQLQSDLREGATSPVDFTGLGLTLRLGKESRNEHLRHIPFSLTIRGWTAVTGRAELAVAVLTRDDRGNITGSHGENMAARVADVDRASKEGLTYEGSFDVRTGDLSFGRVIVVDKGSRELGTITIALGDRTSK